MKTILTNAMRLSGNNEKIPCEILIIDDEIVKIAEKIEEKSANIIDCEQQLVVPG